MAVFRLFINASNVLVSQKIQINLTPTLTGIHNQLEVRDSRLIGNDGMGWLQTF